MLAVAITVEVAESLENFIGIKGDTIEEVASHYISVPHGGQRQKCGDRQEPIAPVAEAAAGDAGGDGGGDGGGGKDADQSGDQISDTTTTPDPAPPGAPQPNVGDSE